jgi:hypothetical protein
VLWNLVGLVSFSWIWRLFDKFLYWNAVYNEKDEILIFFAFIAVLRIRDVYQKSGIQLFSIPDPNFSIPDPGPASKNSSIK